jgi:hypothetical protein
MMKKRITDDMIVIVLADENPKQLGTKAFANFAIYQNGMTVGQVKATGVTANDVAFNLSHGYIALVPLQKLLDAAARAQPAGSDRFMWVEA